MDNVLKVCTAAILNLVRMSLHYIYKSNFREDAFRLYANHRYRLHNLQCFTILKYTQSKKKKIETSSCFNEKNSNDVFCAIKNSFSEFVSLVKDQLFSKFFSGQYFVLSLMSVFA